VAAGFCLRMAPDHPTGLLIAREAGPPAP
jgi:hypothetical protein